jgi:hypothetical protein
VVNNREDGIVGIPANTDRIDHICLVDRQASAV